MYGFIFMLCMGLAKWHIRWNPLWTESGRVYHNIINRGYKIGTNQVKSTTQMLTGELLYREKRRGRVNMMFRVNRSTEIEE